MQNLTSFFKRVPKPSSSAAGPVSNETRSYEEVRLQRNRDKEDLVKKWGLPEYPKGEHTQGAPSYQDRWIRGLHLLVDRVVAEKQRAPLLRYITLTCPLHLKKKGFVKEDVPKYFADFPSEEENADSEMFEEEAVDWYHPVVPSVIVSPETYKDAELPPLAAATASAEVVKKEQIKEEDDKKRKHYTLAEMQIFQSLVEAFPNETTNRVVNIAKSQFPAIFLTQTKHQTFKKFPQKIENILAENAAAKETNKNKKKAAKRLRGGDAKNAPTMAEKETEVQALFAAPKRGGNNRVLPVELLVSMAMMLYAQFLAGVPMNSALALPMMLAHIRNEGHGGLLHSMQPAYPLRMSLKKAGISPEHGKVFITKPAVNKFFARIGLSMRSGTTSHGKAPKPEEVDQLRHLMMLRLLFYMVTFKVFRDLVFQLDETGVLLLPLSKKGRAQKGVSEVKFHGMEEKRQFTLTPIIDGNSKLVDPTQMIWGGEEVHKTTKKPLTSACPSQAVMDECIQELYHTQTPTHWCSLRSLKQLFQRLADHVKKTCEEKGWDYASQYWVVVMDTYAIHISEDFLNWYHEEFPHLLVLFICPNCTAWLQPLDISFNGPFKGHLRQAAGEWLAKHMQQQLKIVSNPTEVELNVKLSHLRPHFCRWVASALRSIGNMHSTISRGWRESGMEKAMELAEGFKQDTAEYIEANELNKKGELFQKHVGKKSGELADKVMAGIFKDIMEENIDDGDDGEADGDPDDSSVFDGEDELFIQLHRQGTEHTHNNAWFS